MKQLVSQLPWGHIIRLLQRIKEPDVRQWYIRASIEHGWSRNILDLQIQSQAHLRQGKAVTNFALALPPADSDMAAQVFKDPYLFDFLGTADPRREREVEQALIDHLQRFLVELGSGFAFVGRQVHLEFASADYYLDLLFYHLKLRCYVVVELKAVPFDPGYVGTLNMYLSAVDDLLRHPDDKPSIGLLLCRSKNKVVVEYALSGFLRPIGVAATSQSMREGSKMPRADWKLMKQYPVAVPPDGLLSVFNATIDSVIDQLRTLTFEARKLSAARDLLLPRLMNGEIAV